MTTRSQAQSIAQGFAKAQGKILPGIYYGIKEPVEYNDCFYFDFLLVTHDGKTPDEPPLVSGASGFIVSKQTGEAEIISFKQLSALNETSSNSM